MKNTNTTKTQSTVDTKTLTKNLDTLDALFKDANGNLALGDYKNAAGYLKSIGLLATALSRQCQQEFEAGLIEELEEMTRAKALREGLEVKRSLNNRELQLSELEASLANYYALVSSSCFITAEDAANSLRAIADSVEKQAGNELFPKPMSQDDMRDWCKRNGIQFVEAGSLDDVLAEGSSPVGKQDTSRQDEDQSAAVSKMVVHRLPTARSKRANEASNRNVRS